VAEVQEQFINLEEGEYPPMEAVTTELVKEQQTEKNYCMPQ
jgi:hypothetical protein